MMARRIGADIASNTSFTAYTIGKLRLACQALDLWNLWADRLSSVDARRVALPRLTRSGQQRNSCAKCDLQRVDEVIDPALAVLTTCECCKTTEPHRQTHACKDSPS